MSVRTVAPKKKAAKKAPAAAKKVASDRIDHRTARAQRQAALTDEQRRTYEQAYHHAGRAMDLAALVYAARTGAGLTQTQLAAAMGTSQSAVAAWENGARTPGIDALERLAEACGKRLHTSRRIASVPPMVETLRRTNSCGLPVRAHDVGVPAFCPTQSARDSIELAQSAKSSHVESDRRASSETRGRLQRSVVVAVTARQQ